MNKQDQLKEDLEYKMTVEENMSSPTANNQSNLTTPVLLESHTVSEEGLHEI